jgi:hypothetical protein
MWFFISPTIVLLPNRLTVYHYRILRDQKRGISVFNVKVSAVTHNGNTKILAYLKVVVVFGELMSNISIVWNNHGNDFNKVLPQLFHTEFK